jgi:subtilase family serine protease
VLSVVYATPQAKMTSTPPAYESGWATEIALDVQWAHATAPLARIVLIEAPDASVNSLLGAIRLANAMGPGAVSMSFGATEGNWTASVDSAFTGAGMSYLAATGDWGTQVSWPAVSPNVLAVSGTRLTYSGSGARSEVTWSNTGGGMSLYTPTPSYQTNKVVGMGTLARRAVADVAFNADPSTGQFVAVMPPGSSTVNWMSAGGTSLSTPQWAGLVAVANAMRALSGKAALGLAHPTIYAQIGSVPGTYASSFADITLGSNGACAGCVAKAGYDQPTGLGTPHVSGLLTALSGASVTATAPLVTAATVNGKAGTALSHAVGVTGGAASAFSLANAPAGMTISSTGTVSWPNPVAGTYSVTVTANGAGGLSGKGVLTFVITKVAAPVITASALTGVAGKPLSGSISFADASGMGLAVTISGVPMGMGFGVSGSTLLVSWPKPVTGKYSLTVVARNGAGQSNQVSVPITINAK